MVIHTRMKKDSPKGLGQSVSTRVSACRCMHGDGPEPKRWGLTVFPALLIWAASLAGGLGPNVSMAQTASPVQTETQTNTQTNNASPQAAWSAFLPGAGRVGQGEFRRWGFLVYDASLWTPQGVYQPGGPFALSLRYVRTIASDRIVDASLDEMRKLGFPVSAHPEWGPALTSVLVDVQPSDTLTGVYTPGQGAVFFHNDRLTGQISQSLARAFFAIWLDPRTSEPGLRQALLGGPSS
jgi:hypothetical protein